MNIKLVKEKLNIPLCVTDEVAKKMALIFAFNDWEKVYKNVFNCEPKEYQKITQKNQQFELTSENAEEMCKFISSTSFNERMESLEKQFSDYKLDDRNPFIDWTPKEKAILFFLSNVDIDSDDFYTLLNQFVDQSKLTVHDASNFIVKHKKKIQTSPEKFKILSEIINQIKE